MNDRNNEPARSHTQSTNHSTQMCAKIALSSNFPDVGIFWRAGL